MKKFLIFATSALMMMGAITGLKAQEPLPDRESDNTACFEPLPDRECNVIHNS